MSSIRIGGILFAIYSHDHPPPHVHGSYGEVIVVVELLPDGVRLADRSDAILPRNGKRSDVKKILKAADENRVLLLRMWKEVHGE